MAVAGSLMVEIGANVARLQRDMSSATSIVSSTTKRMESAFSGVASTMRGLGGILAGGAAISTITSMGSAVVDTGIKFQQLDNAFKSIAGSSAAASTELNFVRETASRLGLDFLSVADSYKGITAAAKGTAMQGAVTRDIFTAVSEAAVVLGMSQQQTSDSLRAISQMMSKGKVSAEELRSQLGEHLPGAFQIAARAMGMTTMELDKFMSDGRLMAEDFLPKFAQALHAQYAGSVGDAAKSAQAEFNRFKTATDELKGELANGLLPIVTDITRAMTGLIKESKEAGSAIKALEGVHQVGVQIEFRTNAAAVAAEIDAMNKAAGIGKSGLAQAIQGIADRWGESQNMGLAGWKNLFFGLDKGMGTGSFRQLENASVIRQQITEMEKTHLAIADGAKRIQAIQQSVFFEGVPSGSGSKVGGGGGGRRGGGGGSGGIIQKMNAESLAYLQAMRTQADAIADIYQELNGVWVGGDAGIKSGGVANELASRRYEEMIKLQQGIDEVSHSAQILNDVWDSVANNMSSSIMNFISGTKASWSEMINSMIADLMRLMMNELFFDRFGGWLKGIVGGAGAASSASALAMPGGRSGGSVTSFAPVINVNVESRGMATGGGTDPRSAQALGEQIGRIVSMKIREEIQGQQRDGGALSRRMKI